MTASIILRTLTYTTVASGSPRLFQDHFINPTKWFRAKRRTKPSGGRHCLAPDQLANPDSPAAKRNGPSSGGGAEAAAGLMPGGGPARFSCGFATRHRH